MNLRRWWLAAAFLAAGGVGALALIGKRHTTAYVRTSLPVVPLVAGVVAAAIVVAVRLARAAADRRVAEATHQSAAAARADRLRLLARLDHEIKNPVTAIRAGLALVTPSTSDEREADALRSVDEQALRLSRLVGDLRKLSDIEQGPIETAPVDLAELVEEVAAAADDLPGAAERTVRVVTAAIPWRVPAIAGDRDLLFLALMNLVANALKFSAPAAVIEVRALEDDHHAVVEVADNGVGIPPDEVDQVWEELARGAAARAVPGTGIGLAMVRTVVARHRGEATIRSRPGEGTVVRLRFPLP